MIGMAPTQTSRASSTSHTMDVEEGPQGADPCATRRHHRQRETVIEEGTEAVEVTVLVEGDSIDDCLDAGLNIELAAPLGERELIDGTTGEPVEVHPNADASIDR